MKVKVEMKSFQQTCAEPLFHYYTEEFENEPSETLHDRILKRIQELEGDTDENAFASEGYPWYSYEIVEQ